MQKKSSGSKEEKNQPVTNQGVTGKTGRTFSEVAKDVLEMYKDLWEQLAKK